MFLDNTINEAYERIKREYKHINNSQVVVRKIDNPFNVKMYERIIEDMEELESPDGEFKVNEVTIGANNGILIELSLTSMTGTKFLLEYIENECIYWAIVTGNNVSSGYSKVFPDLL